MSFYDDIKGQMDAMGISPLTPEENARLFEEAKSGSNSATEMLITGNMKLVSAALGRFLASYPFAEYLVDDLFAEGLMVLSRGVQRLAKEESDVIFAELDEASLGSLEDEDETNYNPIGYLYISIYRAIQTLYERDSSVAIKDRTRDRNTPAGHNCPTKKLDRSMKFFEGLAQDPFAEIYCLEALQGSCQSPTDREIINLRVKGYNDYEIAEQLGIPRLKLWRARRRLYARYCNDNGLRETA